MLDLPVGIIQFSNLKNDEAAVMFSKWEFVTQCYRTRGVAVARFAVP